MTIAELLAWGVEAIKPIAPESAAREASILLAHVLGGPTYQLTLQRDKAADDGVETRFRDLIARRLQRCPVQYLTGECEFYSLKFRVGQGVLIPRPETELLVEAAIHEMSRLAGREANVLEIGTGSGCVVVGLAVELARTGRSARIVATETSARALEYARENARHHGVEDRITFVHADVLSRGPHGHRRIGPLERQEGPPLLAEVDAWKFDLLVSNPPYVAEGDLASLAPEVRDWEPHEALVGGVDGLDVVRSIVEVGRLVLRPRGAIIVEIGAGQWGPLRSLDWGTMGYEPPFYLPDLAGIERILRARLA
ncbi:MAG: peptide chain release factor N(5)-glutamine methyltransferase [Planctomycetota bacterium]|mgnify:CR=1 FL=1